jgi:very-short-patch-repair endonuclease
MGDLVTQYYKRKYRIINKMKRLSIEYPMYFGATPDVFPKARELRKFGTKAENILWAKLKRNQILGLQIRRQHPIDRFIADFYCAKIKLVIEVDGSIHELPENKDYDIGRSEILNEFGITVIRFSNAQIISDIDNVIIKIEGTAKNLMQNM